MKLHSNKLGLGLAGLLVVSSAACFADFGETDSDSLAISPDNRYIIHFADDRGFVAARSHGDVLLNLDRQNAVAAHVPERALEALANSPGVEAIEVDPPRFPLAEQIPYGIEMVQADLVPEGDATGDITVCVIDSGYDINHEDLPSGSNVTKSDISDTGDAFTDGCGHGTHVTGTINALSNDKGVVGVLPSGDLNIHVVKYFNDSCGASFASSLIAAANECVDAGADVINMSLGGSFRNRTEEAAFNELYETGAVLSVAAAGNDGNNRRSYPASYDGVISVAAIDENKEKAEFSQSNSDVELAAPGVGVLSTVPMGSAEVASFSVEDDGIAANGMDGSPQAAGSGPLVDCGLGTSTCEGAEGAVCLIERGEISFADKVLACQDGGGVAAVIYNNEDGPLFGTLGDVVTEIPSAGITRDDGEALLDDLGADASLSVEPGHYAAQNGTSMASPHVAGVAALVWSHHPDLGPSEIRQALAATAEDLGSPGRNNDYGFGLVQAKAALDLLSGDDGDDGDDGDGDNGDNGNGDGDGDNGNGNGDNGNGNGDGGDGDDEDGGQCFEKNEPCEVDADCCSLTCRGPAHNSRCR